jgi:lysophospholipase L1-like esterase
MQYPLLNLALSPLLLVQGLYVRKTTPRLPEPSGERCGKIGTGPTLRLLILGDSAAAGVGVSSQADALSGQLSEQLAANFHTDWQLWAKNGHTSQDILALLNTKLAEPFDVVLISIGVNDITSGLSQAAWLKQQTWLIEKLTTIFSAKHIIYSSLPPMHHFPALPQPLRWVLGERAKQFNAALQQLVEQHPHCQFMPNDIPMQAHFMASDGFHPSATSYTIWAKQVAQLLLTNFNTQTA